MKYIFIIAFLLSVHQLCSSQTKPGCINAALSYSNISNDASPFSVFNNPASAAIRNSSTIALYFSPTPFGLEELSTKAIAAKFGLTDLSILVGYQLFGYSFYKEQKFSVGFSYNIKQKFLVGISAIYHNVSIKNYGTDASVVFLSGAIYKLTNTFNLAFTFFNPANISLGEADNQLPVYYETGFSYQVADNSVLSCTFYKEINFPISFRLGLSYDIFQSLILYFGYKTEPGSISGGMNISKFGIDISYSVLSHPHLGLCHQFGLQANL